MNKKIFISHSSGDKAFVQQLAIDLKRHGIPVWYSDWEIRVGDSITQKIDDALNEMAGLIVVLSYASIRSTWVKEELSAGLTRHLAERDIGIFPVRVDDCAIPPLLSHRRYADFSSGLNGLSELIEAILPMQDLLTRIREIKILYTEAVDALQDVPLKEENWRPVLDRLNSLLEDAVRLRYQIVARLDPERSHDQRGFFEQLEYLVEHGYDLRNPEWAFLVSMRNLNFHTISGYMGNIRNSLYLLESKRGIGSDREEVLGLRLREVLLNLREVFDNLAE